MYNKNLNQFNLLVVGEQVRYQLDKYLLNKNCNKFIKVDKLTKISRKDLKNNYDIIYNTKLKCYGYYINEDAKFFDYEVGENLLVTKRNNHYVNLAYNGDVQWSEVNLYNFIAIIVNSIYYEINDNESTIKSINELIKSIKPNEYVSVMKVEIINE